MNNKATYYKISGFIYIITIVNNSYYFLSTASDNSDPGLNLATVLAAI